MTGWFWRRLGRDSAAAEVEREIRFHLEMRAREFEEAGYSEEDARAAALRSFGDVSAIAEVCREERRRRARERGRRHMWQSIASDVKVSARTLRRNPAFAAAVVLTLGVGIGVATAMAGVLDAYLVRALPYPAADRLVSVTGPGAPDWRDAPMVLENAVSWDLDAFSLVSDGPPERVWTSWVTPGFFAALGVRPTLGRLFDASETAPGGASVALISHALWQRRWGGDPGILGRTFAAYADDRPDEAAVFTIVGVLPSDFWYFNRFTEVLAPLRTSRPIYMATLAAGVSPAEAQEALTHAAAARDPARAEVTVRLMRDAFLERAKPVLWAVAGAVALVLLIACGNAAVLLLVRAAGREQEFAIRSAVGVGRGGIARQLLVEGALISVTATVLGLALASLLLRVMGEATPRLLGTPVPGGAAALRLDVLAFASAAAIACLAGVLFGLMPLSVTRRRNLAATLVSTRGTDTRRRQRVRGVLVAAELALSLALLIGAGLLVRSALHLQRLELGFDAANLVALSLSVRQSAFAEPDARTALYGRIEQELASALPGVSVGTVSWAPFSRFGLTPVQAQDRPTDGPPRDSAFISSASAGYFGTIGIRLLRGRLFDASAAADGDVLVSESLARRIWPGENAVGRQLRPVADRTAPAAPQQPWRTVIGVVSDVRKTLTQPNPPDLYVPLTASPPILAEVVVRDPTGRERLHAMREAVWRVNPELPLNEVRWIADDVARDAMPARFLAWLLSGFAAFALVLATLGLYGVIAYAVGERRREIAIRLALGADPPQVVRLFLRQSGRLVVAGLLGGLGGGYALSRLLASQLHGVSASDPVVYAALALLLGGATMLATWIPARRGAHAEPMQVLERQ